MDQKINGSLTVEETQPNTSVPAEEAKQPAALDVDGLLREIAGFTGTVHSFNEGGEYSVELKKRYMLKAIDEVWVRAIEDTIPSLDLIVRNPGVLLQEKEKILPIEQTKRVTGRSIQHLCQHTDFINEITDDGMVMPSKLLNVYQDETVMTYENKFINTLLINLYGFVSRRYEAAEDCGEDERTTRLELHQKFVKGEQTGNIRVTIDVSEKPKDGEVEKNYVYTTDLWKRVERINTLVKGYMGSPFVRQMGKAYVHPPIMRTNKLLKNVDFRQCLALWEFMEQYENTGYETLVHERLESLDSECLREFYNTIATQYLIFQKHVNNSFDDEKLLDQSEEDVLVSPKIKKELDPLNEREFDYRDLISDKAPEPDHTTGEEDQVEEAIRIALAADSLYTEEEADAEVECEEQDRKIVYRYIYSFLARLIRAQNPTQDYYTEIKNELLSYKKVKSRISWKHENFTVGREKAARINVKGKTLFLYLPLDPKEFADTKYHPKDVSDAKSTQDLPFLFRVRSERGVKFAKELIALVMENLGMERIAEPEIKDYHLPFETNEHMARRNPPLVRIIGEDTTPAETAEELPAEPEEAEEAETEETEETVVSDAGFEFRYRYSFSARLIQSQSPLQDYYGEIKNALLSYPKVKNTMSWNHESFRVGRVTLARMKGRGKTLQLFLALDPSDFTDSKYHLRDVSDSSDGKILPSLLKVHGSRGVKYAKELIDLLMAQNGVAQGEIPAVDYRMPYQTTEELLAANPPLIRLVGANPESGAEPDSGDVAAMAELPVGETDADPTDETPDGALAEQIIDGAEIDVLPENTDAGFEFRYRYSFSARLVQGQNPLQEYYGGVKNYLLSFRRVKAKTSWACESFRFGRKTVARVKGRGKTLQLYLAMDPADYVDSKYHVKDLTGTATGKNFPTLFKVRSARGVKFAKELIDLMMAQIGAEQGEIPAVDYALPEMTLEEMLTAEPPLVRELGGNGLPETAPEEQTEDDAEEPVADEEVEEPVADEEVEESVADEVTDVTESDDYGSASETDLTDGTEAQTDA